MNPSLSDLLSLASLGGNPLLSRNLSSLGSLRTQDPMDAVVQQYKAQQDFIRYSQRFKGQKPRSRPSRSERLSKFHMIRSQSQSATKRGMSQFLTTNITHIYPPSTTSIKDLKPLVISDLVLETHHQGKYLLLKTITPPYKMMGVSVIVEDVKGVAELLSIYNSVDQCQVKFLDHFIPEDSIVLLKDPYFKMSADGNACLRVDHLSDVVFLEQNDNEDEVLSLTWRDWDGVVEVQSLRTEIQIPKQWKKTRWDKHKKAPEMWKEEGNKLFKAGNFHNALRCYTQGLQAASKLNLQATTSEITATLRLNRIQVLHALEFHEKALAESEYFLNAINERNEKAFFRGARALYFLRRFDECKMWLTDKFPHHGPTNADAKSLLDKVESRLKERQSGQYAFAQLREIVKRKGIDALPELDVADYQSPAIEVRHVEKMGRGMVAMRDIEPGELLFVSKAWMIGYSEKNGQRILTNLETNEMCAGAQAIVTEMAILKAWKCPQWAKKELFELWSGTYKRIDVQEVDEKPVVDSYLVDRIRALNAFGCSLMSSDSLSLGPDDKGSSGSGKAAAVENSRIKEMEKKEQSGNDVGIWIAPSLINHSCQANCHRSFIGDIMIVRASARISKGEQLTWYYLSPSEMLDVPNNLEERRKRIEKAWGFKCNCKHCIIEASDKQVVRIRRYQLYNKIQSLSLSTKVSISESDPHDWRAEMAIQSRIQRDNPEIKRLIKDLENTYPASRPPAAFPRIELAFGLSELLNAAGYFGPTPDLREMSKECLCALGWVIEYPDDRVAVGGEKGNLVVKEWGVFHQFLVGIWVHLWWDRALNFGDSGVVEQYKEVARKVYIVACGYEEGFEERFGGGLKKMQRPRFY